MDRLADDDIVDFIAYDPITGLFHWVVRPGGGQTSAGKVAGCVHRSTGYSMIGFRQKKYMAHRVAWRVMTGRWPDLEIDHINGIKTDNRFANLREATSAQNCANRANIGPYPKGVTLHKDGRFQAQIGSGGKNHYLGLFDTAEAANAAYAVAAIELHGEFARVA